MTDIGGSASGVWAMNWSDSFGLLHGVSNYDFIAAKCPEVWEFDDGCRLIVNCMVFRSSDVLGFTVCGRCCRMARVCS